MENVHVPKGLLITAGLFITVDFIILVKMILTQPEIDGKDLWILSNDIQIIP